MIVKQPSSAGRREIQAVLFREFVKAQRVSRLLLRLVARCGMMTVLPVIDGVLKTGQVAGHRLGKSRVGKAAER
jgi:hypothetical protein